MGDGQNYAIAIAGRKRTGKSTYLLERFKNNYDPKQKILLVIGTENTAYQEIPRARNFNELKSWKYGPLKYYVRGDRNQMLSDIQQIAEMGILRQGAVVFEDATAYIKANPPQVVEDFLVDHRMYQLDLWFTLHSLNRVPPFLWEMINYVTVFKTNDTLKKLSGKDAIPNLNSIIDAWKKVQSDKSPFANITVSTGVG